MSERMWLLPKDKVLEKSYESWFTAFKQPLREVTHPGSKAALADTK